MQEGYIIASDMGGTGTKSMLFDFEGNVIAQAFQESKKYYPAPNTVIQKPDEVYEAAVGGMKECIEKADIAKEKVEAIVIDGQMCGLIFLDENYNPVTPFDHWLDTRFAPYMDYMNEKCGDDILEKQGASFYTHGPKILWWQDHHPEIFKNKVKWTIPQSFVAGKLAGLDGEEAYIDETCLMSSGIIDYRKLKWDSNICEQVGIPMEVNPRIVKPTDIIGKLSKESAKELGLIKGIPIVSGAGDFPAAGIGAGICDTSIGGDIGGTASLYFGCLDEWKIDKNQVLRICKSPIEGLWYNYAYFNGGECLNWYKKTFGTAEELLAKKNNSNFYKEIDKKAAEIPVGCNGLTFYPYLGGKVEEPTIRGSWLGVDLDHNRGHFYRAILEGVVYEYKRCHNSLLQLKEDEPIEIRGIGGGSFSNLWNQMKSDALGVPWVLTEQSECSLLGSALIAMTAIGVCDDLAKLADEVVNPTNNFEPQLASYKKYNQKYKTYINILNKHKGALKI